MSVFKLWVPGDSSATRTRNFEFLWELGIHAKDTGAKCYFTLTNGDDIPEEWDVMIAQHKNLGEES